MAGAALLATPSVAAAAPPLTVGELFRTVPLARRSINYYSDFLTNGEFGRAPAAWPVGRTAFQSVLELSAGRAAAWSCAVSAGTSGTTVVAADLSPPAPAEAGVASVSADNTQLPRSDALAAAAPFDLVFASHALCTCQWPLDPTAFLASAGPEQALSASPPGARTCGGVGLDQAGVDAFVGGLAPLLRRPAGVALFDQEGGWPFGLERRLRAAATAHDLHLYVRRGPLLTNFGYVLSAAPLVDDVSADPLQRDARLVDVALLLFAPTYACVILAAKAG